MPIPLIEPVPSYARIDAITAFVRAVLKASGLPDTIFATADADRLVVVKPNWIQANHQHRAEVWEPVITHPALVLATMDRLAESMQGVGTIALCDAPHTYADFEAILRRGNFVEGMEAFRARWPDLKLEVIDLRREVWVTKDDVVLSRHPSPHDPRGYVRCDLGRDSLFYGHPGEGHFYGADYDTGDLNRHHRADLHEYLLAGTPMRCALFVNLPKLKTHKKTGITCSLKNLVGINGDKNWLPHHCMGSPDQGGDEFPDASMKTSVEQALKRVGHKAALAMPVAGPWLLRQMRRTGKQVLGDSETTVRNGNWHGNDTCWRMALDLNRALLYGNPDGTWRERGTPKPYLTIVDGILAGQGNGPVAPEPAAAGVLVGGINPATVDAVCTRLMGYAPADFPIVAEAFAEHRWPIADCALAEVRVADGRSGRTLSLDQVESALPGGFDPHFGWTILRDKVRYGS